MNIFGTGADGNLTVSGTTTVTMRQIYENDNVTGITTYRGAGKGLNKGSATYMASADAMPNFVNVTIDSGQKIIGDTANRYADAGHTFFKCSGTLSGAGSIDESGCGGAGGAKGNLNSSGSTSGYCPDGSFDQNNRTGVGNNATKNNGGGGGNASGGDYGAGGTGENNGSGGAGGGGGNTFFEVTAGGGGGAGYGVAGEKGYSNNISALGTDGTTNQGGDGGDAYSVNGSSGGGGGGGTYGSANFGDNNLFLAGDEFYIGSGGGGAGSGGGLGGGYPTGGANGNNGGGKIKISAKYIEDTIGIYANGGETLNQSGTYGGIGGAGSGGSIWIVSKNAELGSGKITSSGGGYGSGLATYGKGGAGRIRIDGTYTGTTTPTVGFTAELPKTSASRLLLLLN